MVDRGCIPERVLGQIGCMGYARRMFGTRETYMVYNRRARDVPDVQKTQTVWVRSISNSPRTAFSLAVTIGGTSEIGQSTAN